MWTLNKDKQEALRPEDAIQLLKEGNLRFINNLKLHRNLLQQVNETSKGQFPFAVILSCIDSRTSAELIFDQGLGDIFSIRIAGNVLNEDILGSMEFACKMAGVKLIAVLGHTKCGAVQGACDHVKLGHLTKLLQKLEPAIKAEKTVVMDRSSRNDEFVEKVTILNVKLVTEQIKKESQILRELLDRHKIGLIGGLYNAESGEVTFYED